ncbi:hypothetical protein UlMin_022894 [Ulmus minor]
MKPGNSSSRRGLKICCAVTAILLLVVAAVLITLWFTILKPREPEITATPIGLSNFTFSFLPNATKDVTMLISINNKKNYGSFKFKNATALVNYRDQVIAQVPLGPRLVPGRKKLNITADAEFMIGKATSNPNFLMDLSSGFLNLTANASFRGKASVLKIIRIPASASLACTISLNVLSRDVNSVCDTKIKLK